MGCQVQVRSRSGPGQFRPKSGQVASIQGLVQDLGFRAHLDPGRRSQAVPYEGLCRVHLDVPVGGEGTLDGLHLGNVSHERARRVGVDVVDLLLVNPSVLDREVDARRDPEAVRWEGRG